MTFPSPEPPATPFPELPLRKRNRGHEVRNDCARGRPTHPLPLVGDEMSESGGSQASQPDVREDVRRAGDLVLGQLRVTAVSLVPTRFPWRQDLPRRANLDRNSSGVTTQ